jgi:16S rRNA (adenine1518-N6/adenine1519-N6)-dimethyltransferase
MPMAVPLKVSTPYLMQPRKPKLGQNFLVDDNARHRIADALGDVSARTVIEIGPGHGAITNILAERAKRLICIELDRSLVPELRFRFRNHPNVEVIEADVLATDLMALVPEGEKALAIGNLPYYITSDILFHLCAHCAALELAVVMMQREVAERVSAEPGHKEFGLLSATVQMYAGVSNLFTLPPDAFSPPPDVYSTVVRMAFAPRFVELGITDAAGFDRFLKGCFQQKRKTLSNNLRAAGVTPDAIAAACEVAGISSSTRAEALPLDRFAALFLALA